MHDNVMELLRPAVGGMLCQTGGPLVGGMVALCAPEQTVRRSQGGVEGTRILRRRQHRGGLPGSAGQAKCAVPSGGGLTVLQGVTSC